jgi:peptidoglycan/LPS O-acetylase OafA/YrhL
MNYRAEIDGLRALAVIPVILYHAGFKLFTGGYVGVDVFFVISGYLITTIILVELEAGTFSLIHFYERRARRILPALFLVMFACLPFAWFWVLPDAIKQFSQSLVAVNIFSSNILFWRTSGYFDTATELKPLIHTWSLAVEEQYYVLFPLFLMLTWKLGKRWILGLLILIFVISLAGAQLLSATHPSFNFYMLPTRGWELLIGSFIAFYYSRHNIKKHNHLIEQLSSLFGLFLIAYSVFAYDNQTPFPSIYTLVPTIGAALIIIFGTHKTLVGKLLGSKLFVAIGLVSYSAYLWHQPMFAFARERSLNEPSMYLMSILAALSFVLGYLSMMYIERPFRNKHRISCKKVFAYGALCSAFFIGLGLVGYLSSGYLGRTSLQAHFALLEARLSLNHGLNIDCETHFTDSVNCRTSQNPEILVWGDSYAQHLVDGLLASKTGIQIRQATVSVCGPFFDVAPISLPNYGKSWAEKCTATNDKVLNLLKETKSIKYVVLSSPFTQFVGESSRLLKRNGEIVKGQAESFLFFEETLKKITDLGIIPIIFSPPPANGNNIGQCLLKANYFGESPQKCDFVISNIDANQKDVNKFLTYISDSYKVVWLSDGICQKEICHASLDNVFIYRDGGHLSHEGSEYLGKKMNFYQLISEK